MGAVKYRPGYVFGALAVVVALIVAAAAIDPDGMLPIYVGAIAPIALLGGILAYQWAWARSESAPREYGAPASPESDPGAVEDHWEMVRMLAVEPLDDDALGAARAGSMGVVKANVALGAAVAVLPVAAAVMVVTRSVPDLGDGGFLVFLPVVLAPLGLLWARRTMSRAAAAGAGMLEPMGLEMTAMPEVGVGYSAGSATGMGARARGATVIEGERHGRTVRITISENCTTAVGGSFPAFELAQRSGRLSASDGAPAAVRDLVAGLVASPRWKRLRSVRGGRAGIVVERRPDAESGWLWDLWLAERLAAACDP